MSLKHGTQFRLRQSKARTMTDRPSKHGPSRHGTLSLGTLSLGTLSLGTLSLGTLSLGTLSLGTLGLGALGLGALNPELRLRAIGLQLQAIVNRWWQTLVRITFGLFMGGLITLLALLYGGVPIVGS
jgi:hypothetical protein